ncbi:MAG TPA: uroporphyrinogen-III synthase, partial [Paracoccaceae bacterium]|nr:uroporphyrinogen-III synthase [Paracoccaceae bacterium]
AALLEKTGLIVQSCILYDQLPQPLNADAVEALQTHVVDAVTIYSPRTAAAFLDSIRRLKPVSLTVLCISPAACEPLEELPNVNFRIAARPTGRHMVSLIEDFLAESRR